MVLQTWNITMKNAANNMFGKHLIIKNTKQQLILLELIST
jgi:hypothetical protein